MEIAAYYDIETQDWDQFVCGVYLDNRSGTITEVSWENEDHFWSHVLRTQGTVVAHNGGRFDHLACLDAFDRFGILDSLQITLVLSGASISRCRIIGNGINLQLVDSFKMFPMPLRELSNGGKERVGLECLGQGDCLQLCDYQRRYGEPVTGCGGYCRIRRDCSPREMRQILDYCKQDVLALRESVEHMKGIAESLDVDLRFTVGGTTWNTAKRWAKLEKQPLSSEDYHYARCGYYGGRVSLFRRSAPNGHEYDITSSYPFQCSQNLPTGQCQRAHSQAKARECYRNGMDGIYSAKVTVPGMMIPPLPLHAKVNGEKRLAYPVGTFKGTWALPELEYAESLGCTVEPFKALVFPTSEPILAEYMQKLIAARLSFGKDSREGKWLKLVANSLYGKLASRPESSTTYINPPNYVLNADCPVCGDKPCNHLVRIGKRLPIYVKTTEKIPDCGYIVWAAYITARGRIQLHRALTEYGGKDALYCDTDSVFCTERRANDLHRIAGVNASGLPIDDTLGEWAYKGAFADFQGIAPKVYRYVRSNGKPKVKAKGVVMPGDIDAAWTAIEQGIRVESPARPRGFKSAIRADKVFAASHTFRTVKSSFGDRFAIGNGYSRPPDISELDIL